MMNTPHRRLVALAWTVASGLLSLGLLPAAEPVNILSNGGFEDGLAGWQAASAHELVTTAGVAASGQACLTGEVTEPNTHLSLRHPVTLKAGNRYTFEIKARGTNRTKLVLFAIVDGKRQNVAAWEKLTGQWRPYSTPLPGWAVGHVELELIAPSSHAAPAGRIWLDDVAVLETEMPALTPVSDGEGFNDEPAMAAADDGSLYVTWNSFRDNADSLQVARYVVSGEGLRRQGAWQVMGGGKAYVLGVKLVAAGPQVALLYAAEVNGNWDVYTVLCGPAGPADPVRINDDPGVDVNPAGVWKDGRLEIAWETNRNGPRQIMLATLADGQVTTPVAVSGADQSAYNPTVAVRSDGETCVAWHSFRDHNFDIFLRRRTAAGKWLPEMRLTEAPNVDRHAQLLADGDDLWLAYENAVVERYYVGRTNFRRIVIAKVGADGLSMLPGYQDSPLWKQCEAPSIALDRSGRLWVAYMRPRLPRSGWDAYLTCFDGMRWQQPQPISLEKGMDRRPGLARAGDGWAVAFQSDTIPQSWNDVHLTPTAKSDIFVGLYQPKSLPAAGSLQWQAPDEPDEPFEAAELHGAYGEDIPTPSIEYNGQTLHLYYGDLHQHSEVSVCNRLGDQSIEEDYQFSRDLNRLDFACSTDHGYNINPYYWAYTAKLARTNDDPSRFLTFLAEEWTSTFEEYSAEHPYGFYGHRNLILGDSYFPKWFNAKDRSTPAQVWEELRRMNADFIHIPHQLADTGNVPTDWNFADEQAQPVAEIFQVRGSYEYSGAPREAARSVPRPGYFIQDAWARGIVIGVIASPDHGGGYGKACVFAPELSRKAVLQALRERHCFGTTAARMFLDLRVNGHLMGEKVNELPNGPVTLKVVAKCPGEIDRIEVCRNNRFIFIRQPEAKESEFTYVDHDPLAERSYYYVRVIQKDEEIGWTSPVWFGASQAIR